MACMEGAAAGRTEGRLLPRRQPVRLEPRRRLSPPRAIGKLDLIVYLSTTLNTGHAHGLARETIILPVLARDEEPQPTTQESMFNYVRLSDGGPRRHDGPRSEIQIVANLGQRVLGGKGPVDWQSMEQRDESAK